MKADIAIITIREDEFRSVFDRLKEYQLEPLRGSGSSRIYAIFSVPVGDSKNCAVALVRCPEQGSNVSQLVGSDVMRDLDPQLVLVVGIAGGIPRSEFSLGDVVISTRIHDFSVIALNQEGDMAFNVQGGIHPLVSNIAASLLAFESRLGGWNKRKSIGMARPTVDLSWVESNVYGDPKWREDVLDSFETNFGQTASRSQLPLFTTGTIASSNILMKNTDIPTTWRKSARSILAVEMEAAGVLQAAQQIGKQYPVMTIRGISDIIGLKRDERSGWTSYACQSAGAFTCAFIKAGIIEPRDSDTPTTRPQSQSSHSPIQGKIDNSASVTGTQDSDKPSPFDLFISYSAADEQYKRELEIHLAMLKRSKTVRTLHSGQTEGGQDPEQAVKALMDRSQIILLLISPNFLASEDLYDQQMLYAMERHRAGAARVVPIIVRAADISQTPFSKLQPLPRSLQPVAKSNSRDEIWVDIVKGIQQICDTLRNSQKKS